MADHNLIRVEVKCPDCKTPTSIQVPTVGIDQPFIANCTKESCLAMFAVQIQVKISALNFR